jgi:hypothetical protein
MSQFRWASLPWALVIAGSLVGALVAEPPSPSQKDLRVAAEGCLRNRESFTALDCRFTYTMGVAHSVEEALRGEFIENSTIQAKVKWLVNQDTELYELECDPRYFEEAKARAEDEDKNNFTVSLSSHHSLRDKSWKIWYGSELKWANLAGPGETGAGIHITPFSANMMGTDEASSPWNLLKEALAGRATCVALVPEVLAGRSVLRVEFKQGGLDYVNIKYWLDPERGFLPVQGCVLTDKGEVGRVYWTDIRKCSGDRWFPWRAVRISTSSQERGPYGVAEVKVDSLVVDKLPPRSAFQLTLPKGASICRAYGGGSYRLAEAERITLEDIPKHAERCQENLKRLVAKARMLDGQTESRGLWLFGLITGGAITVILLGTGLRWWFRRRSFSHA